MYILKFNFMKKFIKIIENKIKENLKVNKVIVIDNSYKHRKHKSFDSKKYHLFIDIESDHLKSLNKIESHRIIMKILKNEIKEKIHGIEIKIN